MNEYEIYFSLFGKNMRTTVTARSEDEAYEIVRNKIVFHKGKTRLRDNADRLMNIFGMKR